MKWLLDVMTSDSLALQIIKYEKIFRIENSQLLALLGLEPSPDGLFAAVDFGAKFKTLLDEAKKAIQVPAGQRTEFQNETVALYQQFETLIEKIRSDQPVAVKYKVFRIVNDQVLNLLDLKPRPGSYRYAIEEFGSKFEK